MADVTLNAKTTALLLQDLQNELIKGSRPVVPLINAHEALTSPSAETMTPDPSELCMRSLGMPKRSPKVSGGPPTGSCHRGMSSREASSASLS